MTSTFISPIDGRYIPLVSIESYCGSKTDVYTIIKSNIVFIELLKDLISLKQE